MNKLLQEIIKRSGPHRAATCKFNLMKGPSDDWFTKFHIRHSHLKWAVPQGLDVARICQSNTYIIDHFFNTFGKYLVITNNMQFCHIATTD